MAAASMSDIDFRVTAFDAPESVELIGELQAEYMVRYGTGDETPVDAREFAAPRGIFVVGWDAELPVACGGVRVTAPGLAELKRMYVRVAARRRGIARQLLTRLEDEARLLGAGMLRLQTGLQQPEAIAMYESAGYTGTEPFGHYADEPLARHFAKAL